MKIEKRWKQYVQCHVNEIQQLAGQKQWRFCPSELNTADLPLHSCSGHVLSENKKWLHGPEFLKCPTDLWPKLPHLTSLVAKVALTEIVKTPPAVTQSLVSLTDIPFSLAKIKLIMDCSRYTTMLKLWQVTARTTIHEKVKTTTNQ